MSGLSIWHLAPLLPIVLGVIGVALNRGDGTLARWPFGWRIIVLFIVGATMAALIDEKSDAALAVAAVYIAASWILLPFWAVARLRDAGVAQKYWAVLTAVPVVGLFYTLYLLCAASTGNNGTRPRPND